MSEPPELGPLSSVLHYTLGGRVLGRGPGFRGIPIRGSEPEIRVFGRIPGLGWVFRGNPPKPRKLPPGPIFGFPRG